jgi:aminoglycoside phosphotransferase (APT) family kinase protein
MLWVLERCCYDSERKSTGKMKNVQDVKTLSDKLISYLRAKLGNPAIDLASPLARLQGGYETSIYRFELDGASNELSRPLVLRLYPQFYGTWNAIWESTVQNVLAGEGYPVAQAHLVCTDMSILGGAFFIMDHLPGQLLAAAPPESVPGLLGKTHAELHNIDPDPLIKALDDKDIAEYNYRLASRFNWLRDKADKLPWIRQGVNWLLDNRPPEPEWLAVCHGDFHALNILHADGKVTGVLDWPGFAIADPVFDVANSIVLITISGKHLAASMGDFSSVDWDVVVDLYLAAYRAHRPLDDTNLDYYRVRRCVMALVQGVEGQKVWQHPLIVSDLLAYILDVTGIQVAMPA